MSDKGQLLSVVVCVQLLFAMCFFYLFISLLMLLVLWCMAEKE